MTHLLDTDAVAAGSFGWEPEDFDLDDSSVPAVRESWDSGGAGGFGDVSEDRDDVPGPVAVFEEVDFDLPAETVLVPETDHWASFDFKAPSVYDAPALDVGRWIDRRSVSDLATEIVAVAPPSMRHRRGGYVREVEAFLSDQIAPAIAWRLLSKVAETADGDLLMEAVRFRNAWAASDWRLRRTRYWEAGAKPLRRRVCVVRDDKPLYWPQALRFARMLEGRDPESVVNDRTCEEWLRLPDDGSESWWRLVEFAGSRFHPDGPGLVPDLSLDSPRLVGDGPPVVTTTRVHQDPSQPHTNMAETIVSVGEPGRRTRAAVPSQLRTLGYSR